MVTGHRRKPLALSAPDRTVQAEGAPVCTWVPTGRSLSGERPARDIAKHSSAVATPQEV